MVDTPHVSTVLEHATNALPDVDLAEAELAKGTSPFHKVRVFSPYGL
jgi:hypothetical protein